MKLFEHWFRIEVITVFLIIELLVIYLIIYEGTI